MTKGTIKPLLRGVFLLLIGLIIGVLAMTPVSMGGGHQFEIPGTSLKLFLNAVDYDLRVFHKATQSLNTIRIDDSLTESAPLVKFSYLSTSDSMHFRSDNKKIEWIYADQAIQYPATRPAKPMKIRATYPEQFGKETATMIFEFDLRTQRWTLTRVPGLQRTGSSASETK